jgi:hypothetical protein
MATRARKRMIDNAITKLWSICVSASSGEDEESAPRLLAIRIMQAAMSMLL